MRIKIEHTTNYQYGNEVTFSTQYLRITPVNDAHQKIINWDLKLPTKATISKDSYGNTLHVITLDYPHNHISIEATGTVQILSNKPYIHDDRLPPEVFLRQTDLTRPNQEIIEFAESFRSKWQGRELVKLMSLILTKIPYIPGSTETETTAIKAFSSEGGVCQDHTQIFISCCRVLGVPCRYVSGYLCAEDSSHVASHAWAEAWLDHSWYTFDVTNSLTRPERHIKLAIGLDYLDACPVRGIRYGGGDEWMTAFADVEQIRPVQQ